ncbi:MAG: hypothetical protein RIC80_22915 [Cyclobacteriaceae bacterium]
MKSILTFLISLTLLSCHNSTKTSNKRTPEIDKNAIDTVIIKIENEIDESHEVQFFIQSFTYCWVVGNDTLDFKIRLSEYARDSSVQLRIFHNTPILLSDGLGIINRGLPTIEQDFNLANLSSLYLEPPILYKDLTVNLSKSYAGHFGDNIIKYHELSEFLMNSWLENKISVFLSPFNKNTRRYSIEKFHILNKEDYNEYIPNTDLSDYPPFSIHGMGISVIIN